MLGSLLSNVETMVNVTKADLEKLEKPDLILQEKLLPSKGAASKAFRYLEFGIIEKRLLFLKYILDQSTETMIRKVYEMQKTDSKIGDFVYLVTTDFAEIDINLTDEEITNFNKVTWKKLVKEKTKHKAFVVLSEENKTKEKTKHIKFECLEMSKYLRENDRTDLSKIIFSIRSGTLDIKKWNMWKYFDNLCVMCGKKEENIKHFMECTEYENTDEIHNFEDIYTQDTEKQFEIAENAKIRIQKRKMKIEAGLDSPTPGSLAPTCVDEHLWNK